MKKVLEILAPSDCTERIGFQVGWRIGVVTTICCLVYFLSGEVPACVMAWTAIVGYAILAM